MLHRLQNVAESSNAVEYEKSLPVKPIITKDLKTGVPFNLAQLDILGSPPYASPILNESISLMTLKTAICT